MKRTALWLLASLALLVSSCAATLRIQATAPTLDNGAADCADPLILGPTPAASIFTLWFSWTGPETGIASVGNLAPGALAQVLRQVKAGAYTMRAWAVDQAGNTSCDTTATFVYKNNPHKVGGLSSYSP